ncbi:MAG: DUF3822 family protein [Bacteroidales bacterium]|nr:DUF3822 family protein [Bacteroidales bacterium]MCL2737873.1 DUF3822 family protein [Bacteroidales bacterium]
MPHIINKRIDLSGSALYRLSIQADLNGFSFAVLDDTTASCRMLHSYALPACSDYDELYTETAVWCKKFLPAQVPYVYAHCSFCAPSFTLVPNEVFVPEKAAQFLQSIHQINDLDEVSFYTLPELNAVCIYSIPNTLTSPILKAVKKTHFYSVAIPLIRIALSLPGHTRALFYYHNDHLYLGLMREQELLLCNAYEAPQANTALYFLFLSLHQWQLNPESILLYIAGQCSKSLIQLLSRYFPKIIALSDAKIMLQSQELNMRYSLMLHPVPPCASSEAS